MAVINHIHLSELEDEIRYDPQYYTPENMLFEEEIKAFPTIYLGKVALITDGQHGYFKLDENSDIRQITAKCIKEGLVDKTNADRLAHITHNNNLRSSLAVNDVLVTTAGTIGQVGLVTEEIPPANIDQDIGRIAINGDGVSPYFIWAFLQSKFGRFQIERFTTGQVQTHLSLKKMKKLRIPLLPNHGKVEDIVKRFVVSKTAAKEFYTQAQHLLESELGLDKLRFQKPVGYTARFSELEQSRRSDAEFFHTKYEPLISAVKAYRGGWSTLNQLTNRILPNFNGKGRSDYDYIEIGDINLSDGAYIPSRIPTKQLPANAKIMLGGGEILISQVRPTRGAIAITDDTLLHPTVCSGAFYVCTVKDQCQREVIWLYLRLIKAVFEKYCGGTSYPTIESNYIAKFPVPLFEKKLAGKIQDLVVQSKNAKKESQKLLDQAKTRVEQLIEEATSEG
jgi:hypothetical protein